MSKHFLILKVTLSLSLIVLFIAVPVNLQLPAKGGAGVIQFVDGVPLPLPPTPRATGILVADGVPLPVPPTHPPNFVMV